MENNDIIIDFCIDRGGTFTDIFCEVFNKNTGKLNFSKSLKVLSVHPAYPDSCSQGIRQFLSEIKIPLINGLIPSNYIRDIRMGTTITTNALLERKGCKSALIINKGFHDLLEIGNQSRPKIFDLKVLKPEILYSEVLEISGRIRIAKEEEISKNLIITQSGHLIEELEEIDIEDLKSQLSDLKTKGIKTLSVVLLHSYAYPQHEEKVKEIAIEIGFESIFISSQIHSTPKIVPRGLTCLLEVQKFVDEFLEAFSTKPNVMIMQSDGGLTDVGSISASRSLLSGPAGGAVAFSKITPSKICGSLGVIGFDMGGTSTDVSRFNDKFEHFFEYEISGVQLNTPHLDINTVAAGGGSILYILNGMLCVGPESAGANPGPVCYGRNGRLAVSDANAILGRLLPNHIPSIFGPNRDLPLQVSSSIAAMSELLITINSTISTPFQTIHHLSAAFIKIANEKMCRAIREITQMKGLDPSKYTLNAFGGAGGQHACAVAETIGISNIYISRYAGIFSSYGMKLAPLIEDLSATLLQPLSNTILNEFVTKIQEGQINNSILKLQNYIERGHKAKIIRYLGLRFKGTNTVLMVEGAENEKSENYENKFKILFQNEFGFLSNISEIEIEIVRTRVEIALESDLIMDSNSQFIKSKSLESSKTLVWLENSETGELEEKEISIFHLENLETDSYVEGPCILLMDGSTLLVEDSWKACIYSNYDILLTHTKSQKLPNSKLQSNICNPMELSIFSNRFMSIAEQMGVTLQKTATSTNIKERLDFSCAIFDPKGQLVANAPHLPVHLGSMQHAVKYQISQLSSWKDSDVILSNHPAAGGSHLPDLTVITGVFQENLPVFFVASRGHHADIGGLTPGSMPPFSKFLSEEGIGIKSMKIVENGIFNEEQIREKFCSTSVTCEGTFIPGCRVIEDVISDLKAQIAANKRGITLLTELISQYGLSHVHSYMEYLQDNACASVSQMLREFSIAQNLPEIGIIKEEEFMDDGSKICLAIKICRKSGTAVFDFEGTTPQVFANTNVPSSVTNSVILYCLRALISNEIPLNHGCFIPITLIIPKSSLLNPSEECAIVGGNVLTSQRLTDLVLKAFKACAASQGCMNNLTFGDEGYSYYETIGGGSGAGPTWAGRSAVQVHMTNTRITDVEVMEQRYPVLVKVFSIRKNSGGIGRFNGGNGIIREIEFLKKTRVSILSERRVFRPFGLLGGGPGAAGMNTIIRSSGLILNIGGKNTILLYPNDSIRIETPGGGGYGQLDNKCEISDSSLKEDSLHELQQGGSLYTKKAEQLGV